MSEEVRAILAKNAIIQRPLFIGFGFNFVGTAAGITRQIPIKYEGQGIFSPSAVICEAQFVTTGNYIARGLANYGFGLLTKENKPIIPTYFQPDFVSIADYFDNIDSGYELESKDWLNLSVFNRVTGGGGAWFQGCVVGVEYLFSQG